MRADELTTREDNLCGWAVRVTSYRIGERWFASVDNADPGAKVARAEGHSRAEAEQTACAKASERLSRTRRAI
ncbi:MAG: hypothetical protein ACREL7_10865 [Longimicrobiales bacterium]